MARTAREFRPESFELQGRLLLAAVHALIPVNESVQFVSTVIPELPPGSTPTEVVGQQDGEATVVLSRSENLGRSQVQVTTDPSSTAVGVNVAAVDQTVTFTNLQEEAVVTVPILAGAPNPGEVDVNLDVTPITPNVTTSGPLELKILASDAAISPEIVSVQGKPRGIVLTFNKPMNPVGASNLNNYAVTWRSIHNKYDDLGSFAVLMPGAWNASDSASSGSVRLQSARYDPATNSVTIITKREIKYSVATGGITVTQGHPAFTSGQPGDQSNTGPTLTDLEGNPIGGTNMSGQFSVFVFKGLQPTH